MKRWGGAIVVLALACTAVMLLHARGPVPLADHDTTMMLGALKARPNPWSWFVTDWPLQNSFYRPVTAISFVLDLGLFANIKDGYGISAAIYCALCIAAVFWLARELTDSPAWSAGAAALFAFWHTPVEVRWDWICVAVAIVIALIGLIRHRSKIRYWIPAALATIYLATELTGVNRRESPSGFYAGVLLWLPSRTATVMTLFGLSAIAAYARFLRIGPRKEIAPTASDLPATRTSMQSVRKQRSVVWMGISAVCLLFALGSYEQAIMIPMVLLIIAASFRFNGYQIKWWFHAIFWGELVIYFIVRQAILPGMQSDYIAQQVRTGITSILSVLTYAFPSAADIPIWYSGLAAGIPVLLIGSFYALPLRFAGNVAAFSSFKRSNLAYFVWMGSVVAFLPMAFLKPFAHYHYFAMSLRSIFVVALLGIVVKLIVTAVSLPTLQAPPRSSPAPGSLHRQ